MVFFAVVGFTKGDPSLLASPFDADGNQCKYEKGYEDYQKIYISYLVNDPT